MKAYCQIEILSLFNTLKVPKILFAQFLKYNPFKTPIKKINIMIIILPVVVTFIT
jgi:hypothetical protein